MQQSQRQQVPAGRETCKHMHFASFGGCTSCCEGEAAALPWLQHSLLTSQGRARQWRRCGCLPATLPASEATFLPRQPLCTGPTTTPTT